MRNTIQIPNQDNSPQKQKGTLIWNSAKGTFRGSIRQQFTGPRRNNFK